MDEKQRLERATCEHFLNEYNERHETKFEIVEHRDKPDFLVQDRATGKKLGIEIIHLYYDSKEAKMVLGRQPNELHGVMNINGLIDKLNADLSEKCSRAAKYDFNEKMSLAIRVASPIFDLNDFEIFGAEVVVPAHNTFAEIWLVFWDQATKTYSALKQIQ